MALTFNPVSVNLPTPSSFAGGQMGAPVNSNALSSLADLTNIQSTQQGIATSEQALKKAQATYGPDIAIKEAEAKKASTEAQKANFDFNNAKINTYYTEISPYADDKRVLFANNLTPQSSPEDVKMAREGLFDVGDEVIQKLRARKIDPTEAYSMIAPFHMSVLKDPSAAAKEIEMTVRKLAGAANIAEQTQTQYEKNAAQEIIGIKKGQGKIFGIGGSGANPNPTSGGVSSTNEYIKDLNTRNSIALETDMRLGEAKDLLKLVKGGAGTKNFSEIARWAQAANLPTSLVDSIAGGDLSAVQSAQKFITQAVIQGATSNPGTAESINRYIKDNPDIGTDPRALERFVKFTEKLNQKTFDETEFLLGQKKSGRFNPETHVQEVQQFLRKQYLPNEKEQVNKSEPTKSTRKIVREGIDKSTGRAVVQYDDGTTGWK